MLVTDNSVSPRGLQYADDYTSTYCDRSLVDKYYVDSIATGLNVHAAVVAASTVNLPLTGTTGTVDGVAVTAITAVNNRILVKSQTNAALNGIYSATTGAWGRTDDYDFTPSGEISNGDLIPVISGTSNANSQWINVSDNPIVSGDSINFSVFSQQQGIVAGNGICVDTVGSNKQVSVKLSPSNAGICFDSDALELDYNVFTCGLDTSTAGEVRVCASLTPATGTEIPVLIGTGGALFVDRDDFSYTTASNGLTKVDTNVTLGGALTGDTSINGAGGAYGLSLLSLSAFTLSFGSSNITDNSGGQGLVYSANYAGTFIDNSLVSKYFVNNAITGSTLTYNNGLTKQGKVIRWGGALTGATSVTYGSGRICMSDAASISCVDLIAECTTVRATEGSAFMRSCVNAGTEARVTVTCTGTMSLVATNATQGLTITSAAHGAVYAGDYEPNFVARSLATAAYVTGKTSTSGIQTAANGLTKVGTQVRLGGTLTGTTTINGAQTLRLNVTTFNVTGATNLTGALNVSGKIDGNGALDILGATSLRNTLNVTGATTILGAIDANSTLNVQGATALQGTVNVTGATTVLGAIDANSTLNVAGATALQSTLNVTGATSLCSTLTLPTVAAGTTSNPIMVLDSGVVKCVAASSYNVTATNGITATGNQVKLGGALTETTSLSGAQTLRLNISAFNVTGATTVTGAATISGAIDANSTLNVAGATALQGTVNVTGATTLTSLTASGAIDANSTLNVAGATALQGTVNVTGATTLTSLTASGTVTLSSVASGSTSDPVLTITSGGVIQKISASSLGEDNNRYAITAPAANSTINLTGSEYTLLVDTSTGVTTVQLPVGTAGMAFKIKDRTGDALANNITIDGNGGETIDGALTALINTDYGAIELVHTGTEWLILSFVN